MQSPRAKTHNYLNLIMADKEVKARHPEAWSVLLDENGNLAEGTGSNIFAVRDGRLLTPRERYYIEGFHYSSRPATLARAIDAYKKCSDFDAGHQGCRHNLGLIYFQMERYAESIAQYQELVRRGGTFACCEAQVYDKDGELVASGRGTYAVPQK